MDSDLRNPKRREWPTQSCVMDHRHSHYCQGELARPVPCSWQVRKQPPVTTPVMAIALKLRQPFPGPPSEEKFCAIAASDSTPHIDCERDKRYAPFSQTWNGPGQR